MKTTTILVSMLFASVAGYAYYVIKKKTNVAKEATETFIRTLGETPEIIQELIDKQIMDTGFRNFQAVRMAREREVAYTRGENVYGSGEKIRAYLEKFQKPEPYKWDIITMLLKPPIKNNTPFLISEIYRPTNIVPKPTLEELNAIFLTL